MSESGKDRAAGSRRAPGPAPRRRVRIFIGGLMAVLGIGRRPPAGSEPTVPDSNVLSLERTYLSSERTLMGWVRTALSMISFGFTIGKLGQALQNVEIKGTLFRQHTLSVQNLAYFLVVLGTVALFGAACQHVNRAAEYKALGLPVQLSISFVVAVLLILMGGFSFTALVLNL